MNVKLAEQLTDVIFIGLPGPTHHYGGLSGDNLASSQNKGAPSEPRNAALQALHLAENLLDLGAKVALLPPQLRPYLPELRKYFKGSDSEVIEAAKRTNPLLLEACTSSAAMWTANAATITTAGDSKDGKLHMTIANLHTNFHRRIEASDSYKVLWQIFVSCPDSTVHFPLNAELGFSDEGAANHMWLSTAGGGRGLNVFVYGTDGNPRDPNTARQTLAACQEIAKTHALEDEAVAYVKQNPIAIEAGVFHNDVIAVSHHDFLLVHEDAYALGVADIHYIADSYAERTGQALILRVIKRDELSLEEAVATYFFNSQILSKPDGSMVMIAPTETKTLFEGKASQLIETIISEQDNPIKEARFIHLTQSMRNGGGPACLRLRVPMNDAQIAAVSGHSHVMLNNERIAALRKIINEHYPEQLHAGDINEALYQTSKKTLLALGEALKLKLV